MGVLLGVCHTLAAIFMAREFLHLRIHQVKVPFFIIYLERGDNQSLHINITRTRDAS